ncbi:MAG: hypothetical protein JWO06_3153 [Bacteroidota bacterium]|nr:hypothetical protein [Bacteroidota bacterium]
MRGRVFKSKCGARNAELGMANGAQKEEFKEFLL